MSAAGDAPSADYEERLRSILAARDWEALREFSREQNQIPDDVYAQPQHFWEVMLHKLTCGRIDLLGLHDDSRTWLAERDYTPDLGGVLKVRVRVVPFARIREILGASALERLWPDGATAGEAWASLASEFPPLEELSASTRLLRNDVLVAPGTPLADGDELALLPPFGGG